MRIKQGNSTKIKTIFAILAVSILLGAGVFAWNWYLHKDEIKRDANGVSLERTPQDKKLEDELNKDLSKKESNHSDLPQTPSIDPESNLQKVNVVLTNVAQSGDQISASGFVSNVVESDGVCSYLFTNGSNKVEKQSTTLVNSTSTTCKSISFSGSELSIGKWEAQISYSSSLSSGISNKMELIVR